MDVFEALDLTEGEKKVYAALIDLKSTTTGPLYKKANVSQSKVYEILERLKSKGLVASILKNSRKFWHPANPSIYVEKVERELELIRERKQVLEKELPQLLKEETYPQDEAQVLTGYNGFRTALYSFLDTFKPEDEFLILGSPTPIEDPFKTFLKSYNLERIKRDIHAKFLYGESLRKFATGLYTLPKTKLKFMRGLTPSTIAIGNDRIIIITWEEKGKCVVIMGKEIANNYRLFFESLWNLSKY